MELDRDQKAEFANYWGKSLLIHKGNLVFVGDVHRDAGRYKGIGYEYKIVDKKDALGQVGVVKESLVVDDLEALELYSPETGYYQLTKHEAFWINKKPERSMRKGMCSENTEVLGMGKFTEKDSIISYYARSFSFNDFARIYHNALPAPTIAEWMKMNEESDLTRSSLALSRNVALLATDFHVPIVMYMLNPVGYYAEDAIFLCNNKVCSKELIEEETKLTVNLY